MTEETRAKLQSRMSSTIFAAHARVVEGVEHQTNSEHSVSGPPDSFV
jgi:hypothetical protein